MNQQETTQELGLYLHIPFCHRACSYCNFFYSVHFKKQKDFVSALIYEIQSRSTEIEYTQVRSIYFGGGTPSTLDSESVHEILTTIYSAFRVKEGAEITFEMNPEDCDELYLKSIKEFGINRISLGIQSFHEEAIKLLNRGHSEESAKQSIQFVEQNFQNYSVDIIYGIQNADQNLKYSLSVLEEFQPSHISAYQLTIEDHTVLGNQAKKGMFQATDDDHIQQDLDLLLSWCKQNGFEQYEVSNFARGGSFAIHNSAYWEQLPYLGFGPSASTYNGKHQRSKNIPSIRGYIELFPEISDYQAWETEQLSKADVLNEFMMLRFRTTEGIVWNKVPNFISEPEIFFLKNRIINSIFAHCFEYTEEYYRILPEYFWTSDQILEELWIEED